MCDFPIETTRTESGSRTYSVRDVAYVLTATEEVRRSLAKKLPEKMREPRALGAEAYSQG